MYPARHISVSINRTPQDIYDYASNPQNLPNWALGLSSSSIRNDGEGWICESPMGRVKIKFVEKNSLGVMDHDVELPSGEINHNPFRVVANGRGGEVVFTLYQLSKMSDVQFEQDATLVQKDLLKLKSILEK